jgi:phosphoadenosine phosphosulfate reductase
MPPELAHLPLADKVAELNAPLPPPRAVSVLEHALAIRRWARGAGVVLRRRIGRAAAHGLGHGARPAGAVHRHADAVPRNADYQRRWPKAADQRATIRAHPLRGQLAADPDGTLHRDRPRCLLRLRKTAPLERALAGFDAWITGRKRYQGGTRGGGVLRGRGRSADQGQPAGPLGRRIWRTTSSTTACPGIRWWRRAIPRIGCAPCTSPVAPGRGDRARGAGAGRTRTNAASISSTARSSVPERRRTRHERDRHRCGFPARRLAGRLWAGRGSPRRRGSTWPRRRPRDAAARPAARFRSSASPFPGFADGRGFTIAHRLRLMGYTGRLRAHGHVWPTSTPWRGGRASTRSRSPTTSPRASPGSVALSRRLARHDYQARLRAAS